MKLIPLTIAAYISVVSTAKACDELAVIHTPISQMITGVSNGKVTSYRLNLGYIIDDRGHGIEHVYTYTYMQGETPVTGFAVVYPEACTASAVRPMQSVVNEIR